MTTPSEQKGVRGRSGGLSRKAATGRAGARTAPDSGELGVVKRYRRKCRALYTSQWQAAAPRRQTRRQSPWPAPSPRSPGSAPPCNCHLGCSRKKAHSNYSNRAGGPELATKTILNGPPWSQKLRVGDPQALITEALGSALRLPSRIRSPSEAAPPKGRAARILYLSRACAQLLTAGAGWASYSPLCLRCSPRAGSLPSTSASQAWNKRHKRPAEATRGPGSPGSAALGTKADGERWAGPLLCPFPRSGSGKNIFRLGGWRGEADPVPPLGCEQPCDLG